MRRLGGGKRVRRDHKGRDNAIDNQESDAAMKTLSAADVEQAKLDPATVFDNPADVLRASLSTDDKKSILRRWEEDADALIRATDEGMEPSDNRRTPSELLAAIQAAIETLENDI